MITKIRELKIVEAEADTKPSLNPELRQLIFTVAEIGKDAWGNHTIYPHFRPRLPAMTDQQRISIAAAKADFERAFTPVRPEWLSGRITTLLAHFFVPAMDAALQTALLVDWLTVLGKYPRWAIIRAVNDYLSTEKRRPVPGDIVERCEAETTRDRGILEALTLLAAPPDAKADHA